ncbi:hypothetical protein [Candidatus Leptofilum sp.]|uniref:hypothetical protein n=1 Tax=Candidatus Leptofilum sp. TaxID=3241576 RepID=UPI003B591FCA
MKTLMLQKMGRLILLLPLFLLIAACGGGNSVIEEELRSELKNMGWFEGFTPALIEATEDSIRWSVSNGYRALSPPVVIYMDLENIDSLDEPYRQLLEEFAKNSYNLFQPTNIKERYVSNSDAYGDFVLTFENNGREYEITFLHDSDWVSFEFFNLLDQLMADSGTNLRFVEITHYTGNFTQEVVLGVTKHKGMV